jgi:3-hydroxyisobutyrate dehydrogenase-like beta-hydroxyacid dehydrogenase
MTPGPASSVITSVAVMGTGRMGSAMAGRLSEAGFAVTVWNRTRSRAEVLASRTGAEVAVRPRQAAEAADAVIVSLADDAAGEAAYAGPEGLIAGLRPGAVVLEMSTIDPDTVRGLKAGVERHSAALLDAPVSGSVSVVEAGALTFMVGGDPAALDRVRPVLNSLGKKVFHLGAVGAGATMKIVVNAFLLGINQALAESLVLAERAGLSREAAYDVFAAGAVASPFVHYKRQAYLEPDSTPVAFMLDLVAKDLRLAEDLATHVAARMDQLSTNLAVAEEAVREGLGERDLSAIAVLLRRP